MVFLFGFDSCRFALCTFRGGDLMRRFLAFFLVFCLTLICPVYGLIASAAAVAAPVAAESIAGLLVALGLIVGDEVSGYEWSNPLTTETGKIEGYYTKDIFAQAVPKIKSGEKLTKDDLGALFGTVIASGTYTTDGTNYYVSGSSTPVTASDLFVLAKSLVGVSYSMPTNVIGVQKGTGFMNANGSQNVGTCLASPGAVGTDQYFFPMVETDSGAVFIRPIAMNLNKTGSGLSFDFSKSGYGTIGTHSYSGGIKKYWAWDISNSSSTYSTLEDIHNLVFTQLIPIQGKSWVLVQGSDTLSPPYKSTTMIMTRGQPQVTFNANSDSLGDSIVQVKPSDDDDNSGSTPPAPVPPNNWEVWRTIEDLTKFISTGEITNGSTTLDQFVNNNYNYVDVDINVPDSVDVNLGGGLDINGSGDINVNVNENISVPSVEGDGGKFYNLTLWDSLKAVAIDNPMIGTVTALIQSIDPTLVALCSLSLSLIMVLAIWRFLRGG